MAKTYYRTHEGKEYITPGFLANGGERARAWHIEQSENELAFEQSRDNLLDPIVSVDRRQKKRVENVAFGGRIEYADSGGDLNEIVDEAIQLFLLQAPFVTGQYVHKFTVAMGKKKDGITGLGGYYKDQLEPDTVVYLYDTAPYATFLEAYSLPTGILYFVFNKLRRKYGARFSFQFDYKRYDGGTVPVLSIAMGGVLFTTGVRPGTGQRRRKRS